jgi:hypothetical protein
MEWHKVKGVWVTEDYAYKIRKIHDLQHKNKYLWESAFQGKVLFVSWTLREAKKRCYEHSVS